MMHRYGETNRYAKIEIPTNDGPRIPKPAILERIQYERHQYSPLYCGLPATTPVVGEGKPVRLLELLPPDQPDSDMVCGKLHVHSLDKAPAYEAISYAWGVDKAQDFPLFIAAPDSSQGKSANRKAIHITPQLYAALRRIRHPSRSRFVWADQICINQTDKAEKSQQVRQMGDIYRKATGTLIWLGEEDSDKDIIATILEKLRSTRSKSVVEDCEMISKLIDIKGPTDLPAPEQLGRHAVERLLNRTWFSRVWVFEESVVSKGVEVRYGSLSLPLTDLFRLTRAVFTAENFVGGYSRSIAKRTVGFDTIYLVQHSRGGCGEPSCPRDNVKPSFLGIVMQALQQLHATKEVDLIYAFTGLDSLESLKIRIPKIEIDYTLPVRTVWINAARSIIQSSSSLDIFATARGDATCKYDIPSWVPDLLKCYPYGRPITAPDFISAFNASGNFSHAWEEADDIDTLIVKGKVIGTIKWFSPLNFELEDFRKELQGVKNVLQYEAHAAKVTQHINIHTGTGRSHELLGDRKKILRTILADGAFSNDQPLKYDMNEIIQVYEEEDKIQKRTNNASAFGDKQYEILEELREWALIAQQKRLFLSDGYDVGLVPKTAKIGDLICLLHGSKVPCILRQTADSKERYRIISQCYLDGKMNYEGSPERREFLGKDPTTFLLV
ncbi:hypothetical protein Asppvi_003463 [Aspergillus pseudoviridinutans]|uniref:Heterokaryon incompatibility domain-containing protein n=1 Tax=Aspergillus pseudoviridinutans TaxID=1517512 RepID=A0A9P3BAW2_9EURO|nr:uncharacterized protein Asppvi_003463 [Aspergillus pseudoviridinutans]GIJ84614.1 hypothetical protein Asppvi_003463 [Aspergillus pseudoviridinutans]